MKPYLLLLIVLPALIFANEEKPAPTDAISQLEAFIASRKETGRIDTGAGGWRLRLPKFPSAGFEAGGSYRWILDTSEGEMTALLNHEAAPEHVRNTLYLSLLGYYDGLKFHRIIPGFMAQGGCPQGSGTGGPGYSLRLEVTRDALHKGPGVLSMARSQSPNSAGSQFFITFGDAPNLDMQYSVFGRVVEGLDVLKQLEAAGNPNPQSNGVPPRKTITINSSRVEWIPPLAEAQP